MRAYIIPEMKILLFSDEIMNDIFIASNENSSQSVGMLGTWNDGRTID